MLDWLKNINKDYPEFWKLYLSKFSSKSKRFVVINCHTSGLDPEADVIYSISAISVEDDKIIIGDNFEVMILQYIYLHDNNLSNEFIIHSQFTKLAEPQAIQSFIDYIGNAVIIGHNIHLEIELINQVLEKLNCGRIKNEILDIEIMYKKLFDITDNSFTLKELCDSFKINTEDMNTTSDKAYNIALLFLKLKSRLGFK